MTRNIKFIIIAFVSLAIAITLIACGNRDMFDTNYTFDYALISFPDGDVKKIDIKQWKDYDGEQVQIVTHDGEVYLVNSVNCVLVRENNN